MSVEALVEAPDRGAGGDFGVLCPGLGFKGLGLGLRG